MLSAVCDIADGNAVDYQIRIRAEYIRQEKTKRNNSLSAYKLKFSQKIYRFIKAIMDFVVALIAVIILSPLFIVVAVAIKIDSRGPIFFVQTRIGKNGKPFRCIKFRSMANEANHEIAGYKYAGANEYVTKVGAFIRKFSIDELPQFFNVLTFKMSLIGFRPAQGNETELNEARESYDVYQIRPGISGWAQVNGRDILASHPKEKAKYDAYYMQHFSLLLDVKILFMTIVKVFKSDDIVEGIVDDSSEFSQENFNEDLPTAELLAASQKQCERSETETA